MLATKSRPNCVFDFPCVVTSVQSLELMELRLNALDYLSEAERTLGLRERLYNSTHSCSRNSESDDLLVSLIQAIQALGWRTQQSDP